MPRRPTSGSEIFPWRQVSNLPEKVDGRLRPSGPSLAEEDAQRHWRPLYQMTSTRRRFLNREEEPVNKSVSVVTPRCGTQRLFNNQAGMRCQDRHGKILRKIWISKTPKIWSLVGLRRSARLAATHFARFGQPTHC